MPSLDFDRELLAIEKRKNEHGLIAMATQELLGDKKDIGSWGKALMESEGNADLANSLYLKHRVQKLQDEISEDLIKKAKEKFEREEAKRKQIAIEEQIAAEEKAAKEVERQRMIDKHISDAKQTWNLKSDEDLRNYLGFRYEYDYEECTYGYTFKGSSKLFHTVRDAYIEYYDL